MEKFGLVLPKNFRSEAVVKRGITKYGTGRASVMEYIRDDLRFLKTEGRFIVHEYTRRIFATAYFALFFLIWGSSVSKALAKVG